MGLTHLQTKDIVQRTLDEITHTLVAEGRIELRNFGVFEIKRHAPRKARNPRTGEKVDIPAKNVVTFKPGKEMEEQVRKLDLEAQRNSQGKPGSPGRGGSGTEAEAEAETEA